VKYIFVFRNLRAAHSRFRHHSASVSYFLCSGTSVLRTPGSGIIPHLSTIFLCSGTSVLRTLGSGIIPHSALSRCVLHDGQSPKSLCFVQAQQRDLGSLPTQKTGAIKLRSLRRYICIFQFHVAETSVEHLLAPVLRRYSILI